MRTEILTVDRELKLARQEGDAAKVREILRDARPELRLVQFVKASEQNLKELRTQQRKMRERYSATPTPALQERMNANRERQKAIMLKALERYNSSIDQDI